VNPHLPDDNFIRSHLLEARQCDRSVTLTTVLYLVPGVAQRVPGGLGSQIFMTFVT